MIYTLVRRDKTIRQRICLVNTTSYGFLKYNRTMPNTEFKERTFAETLQLLCNAVGGNFLRNGALNQSEVARKAKTKQPNVSRWLNGVHDPDSINVAALAETFGISKAQMRGEDPIDVIDGDAELNVKGKSFMYEYAHLPEPLKHAVRENVHNLLEASKSKT